MFYFEIAQYTNVTINFTAGAQQNNRGVYYIRVHTNYNRLPCDVVVFISYIPTQTQGAGQGGTVSCSFSVDDLDYTQNIQISSYGIKVSGVEFRNPTYKDDKNEINYTFTCQY